MKTRLFTVAAVLGATLVAFAAAAGTEDIEKAIADLDTEYQSAVERNDWRTMDRILHPEFALVLGNGKTYTRQELIDSARNRTVVFEKQVEVPGTQKVRVYGADTATVTALLLLKGKRNDDQTSFDYKLWFTDTYVRTKLGWRYAFGQASLKLPPE